jgi:hypothetical protein
MRKAESTMAFTHARDAIRKRKAVDVARRAAISHGKRTTNVIQNGIVAVRVYRVG